MARRVITRDRPDPRAERGQPIKEHTRLTVHPGDVATGERSERVERTRNLALDVEGGGETPRKRVGQHDGQVRHERRV